VCRLAGHQSHGLNKQDTEQEWPSPLNATPKGLEERLSEQEFVDLVAYLMTLQEDAGR
jgi:hypothetical protein